MCMNCGCGEPENDHGKPDNITADDLRRAGDANGQSLRESAQHILDAAAKLDTAAHSGGLAQPGGSLGTIPAAHGTEGSES